MDGMAAFEWLPSGAQCVVASSPTARVAGPHRQSGKDCRHTHDGPGAVRQAGGTGPALTLRPPLQESQFQQQALLSLSWAAQSRTLGQKADGTGAAFAENRVVGWGLSKQQQLSLRMEGRTETSRDGRAE